MAEPNQNSAAKETGSVTSPMVSSSLRANSDPLLTASQVLRAFSSSPSSTPISSAVATPSLVPVQVDSTIVAPHPSTKEVEASIAATLNEIRKRKGTIHAGSARAKKIKPSGMGRTQGILDAPASRSQGFAKSGPSSSGAAPKSAKDPLPKVGKQPKFPILDDDDEEEEPMELSGSSSSDPEFRAPRRRITRNSGKPIAGSSKSGSKDSSGPSKPSKAKPIGAQDGRPSLPLKKRMFEVTDIPSKSHFRSNKAMSVFSSVTISRPIIYEKPFDFANIPPAVKLFVDRLGWVKALESFPRVNISLVQEFYANFPENVPAEIKLRSTDPIMVWVRGVEVDIRPARIREVLSLPITEKHTMTKVFQYRDSTTIDHLASLMYYPPPTEPLSDPFLSSSLMPEWYKFMTFVARSLLTPTTQTSKITHLQAVLIAYFCDKTKPLLPAEYYIFQAIRRAAIPQRLSVSSSIVFPAVITLLCIKSNVPFHGDDALALPVNPVDRVTIAKSAAQSGLYVESLEQTLLKKEIKLIVDKAMQEAVIGFRDYVGHQFYTFKQEMPAILREFERSRDEDASGSSTASSQDPHASSDPDDEESESDDDVIRRESSDDEDASI